MKFNKALAAVTTDLDTMAHYKEAIANGSLVGHDIVMQDLEDSDLYRKRDIQDFEWYDREASEELEISGFWIEPRAMVVDEVTRHRETHQIFVPIGETLLVVTGRSSADDPGQPDPKSFLCVPVYPGQGLQVNRGVWHTLPFSFTRRAACLSVMHRETLEGYHDVRDLTAVGWVGMLAWPESPVVQN